VGYRYEQAKYKYNPNSGKKLNDKDNEYAFNAGYNYKLKNNGSIYFNFTRAFQFPDIDRFFTYDFNLRSFQFNKFIKTMLTKTYTIGYNNITDNQKFKISAFCIKAENEIYYNPLTFKNTNLDKTKKKGFDVEYRRKITDFLSGNINYSYIISKIKEDDNIKYEGKIIDYPDYLRKTDRTGEIEILLKKFPRTLIPGMNVDVEIPLKKQEVIMIPLETLLKDPISRKYYVFVVKNNSVKKVYVERGKSVEGYAIITKGLKVSDKVVLKGAHTVNENSIINIVEK